MNERLRLAWVTNKAAPYRVPIWTHLGESWTVEVILLENNRRFLRDPANRGTEWAAKRSTLYAVREQPTWRLRRGETELYISRGSWFRSFTPDVVLIGGWESPAYWQALIAARIRSIPAVGFYESTLESHAYKRGPIAAARRLFFRSLNAVVVPGPAAMKAVLAMGVSPDRIHTGFNAVDVEAISSEARMIRTSQARRPSGHRFIFVGQLIDRKNPVQLVLAFAAAANAEDELTIVGDGPLRSEIDALQVANVTTLGLVPAEQIAGLLATHDTLVLPSTEEVWGLVVNEALAAGLNVVVTDVSGVTESVKDMDGVFVVEPTKEKLAEGMAESRQRWRGPRDRPAILAHGPREFAEVFQSAFASVLAKADDPPDSLSRN